MGTVLFYEESDPETLTVAAYDAGERRWQAVAQKASLALWLRQAHEEGRLSRQDAFFCVLAESQLVRALIALPAGLRPSQQRGMAASHLIPRLGEKPAAIHLVSLAGTSLTSVTALSAETLAQVTATFGRYASRLQFVGAADLWLARQAVLPDGYYILQGQLWTAVVATSGGRVIDGRAGTGESALVMHQALREAHQDVDWQPTQPTAQSLPPGEGAPDVSRLALAAFRAPVVGDGWRGDKTMAALFLGCVVVPGLLALALMFWPQAEAPSEDAQLETASEVRRSSYSTLLSQAYSVKSERITLLSQDAGEGVLALSGRCAETLDLADYMKSLAAAGPQLQPLLLELTRVGEEDGYHYEFVLQIGEGGEIIS